MSQGSDCLQEALSFELPLTQEVRGQVATLVWANLKPLCNEIKQIRENVAN